MTAVLELSNITVRYGEHTVVDSLSVTLEAGQWLMLCGPNGAGKSSLISAVSQAVPSCGLMRLDGQDLRRMKPAQIARKIGVLAQKNDVGYDYTVEEIVSLGRYAHAPGFLAGRDRDGEERVAHALALTGLESLRRASVLTLSGGELQRTFLAQVFAQDPQLLILDEPANHLDLVYQKHIFTLIGQWLEQPGRAVISVVHDLSLARRYGTHAVLMHQGKSVAQGEISAVLTPANLQSVYNMDVAGWMREMLGLWQEGNA